MTRSIAPIVEGQSEVESVPILLRRILYESLDIPNVQVAHPFRVKRNRVVRVGELERAIEMTLKTRAGVEAVLVVLDADDDCPARLGPALKERAERASAKPAAVVFAKHELEAWFLGAKESLRGVRGIAPDAAPPTQPENIRGAKERLSRNMRNGRYLEVDDQSAFAERMNFEAATRACPSFARLVRVVEELCRQMPTNT